MHWFIYALFSAPKKTPRYLLPRCMSQTLPLLSLPTKSLLHQGSNCHRGISIIGFTTQLQQRKKADEELEVHVDTRLETAAAFLGQLSVFRLLPAGRKKIPVSALGACLCRCLWASDSDQFCRIPRYPKQEGDCRIAQYTYECYTT